MFLDPLKTVGQAFGSVPGKIATGVATAASGSWIPMAIGTVGSLLGSVLTYRGAREANRQQRAFLREERRIRRGYQLDDRKYAERRADTAIYNRMQDLKRSGVNPIYYFNAGGQGAATPMAHISPGQKFQPANELAQFVHSALSLSQMYNEVQLGREAIKAAKYENVGNRIEANIDRSLYGKAMRYLDRGGRSVSSAAQMINVLKGRPPVKKVSNFYQRRF